MKRKFTKQPDKYFNHRQRLARVTILVVFFCLLLAFPARAAEMKSIQLFFKNTPVTGEAKAITKDSAKFVNLPFLNQYLQIISQWDPDTGKIELKFGKLNLALYENQVNYSWNDDSKKLTRAPFTVDDQLWIPLDFVLELGLSVTQETETQTRLDWRDNYLLKIENTTYQNRPAFLVTASGAAIFEDSNLLVNPDRLMVDLKGLKMHPAFEQIIPGSPVVKNIRAAQYNPETVRLVFDLNQLAGYKVIHKPETPQKLLIVLNCFVSNVEFIKEGAVRQVRITTSLPTQYRTTFVNNPHRMIIDLEGTTLQTPVRQIAGDGAWIKSIRLGQFDSQTVRVVLDLGDQTPCYVQSSPADPKIIDIRTLQTITKVEWSEPGGRLQITGDSDLNEVLRRFNNPDRLQIDLNFFKFSPELKTPKFQTALITGIRIKTITPDLARIEVDLPKFTVYQTTLSPNRRQLTIEFSQSPLLGRTIVLDAGHGGVDPGTCGSQGTREKEITLDVTLRLKNLLEEVGARVVLTRTEDFYISLFERPWLANFVMAELFISIHCNSYVNDRGIRGTEIFYFQGRSSAKQLATHILEKLTKVTGLTSRGVRSNNFVVLNDTQMPSILAEIGYLSNFEEETLLNQEIFRAQVALGIFQGLLAFYSTDAS